MEADDWPINLLPDVLFLFQFKHMLSGEETEVNLCFFVNLLLQYPQYPMSLYVCLCICLCVCLCICLCICLSVYLCVCLLSRSVLVLPVNGPSWTVAAASRWRSWCRTVQSCSPQTPQTYSSAISIQYLTLADIYIWIKPHLRCYSKYMLRFICVSTGCYYVQEWIFAVYYIIHLAGLFLIIPYPLWVFPEIC